MGSQDRYQSWIDEAKSDWETARVLMEAGRFNACVFYCQQCAGKAMRSLLLRLRQVPWGHSVWNLYLEASRVTRDDDAMVEEAAKNLDLHYVPSRYPDALPCGNPSEFYDDRKAKEAMGWAKMVLEYVERCT